MASASVYVNKKQASKQGASEPTGIVTSVAGEHVTLRPQAGGVAGRESLFWRGVRSVRASVRSTKSVRGRDASIAPSRRESVPPARGGAAPPPRRGSALLVESPSGDGGVCAAAQI